MNIAQMLNLRFEFEEIVKTLEIPKDRCDGVLKNMQWFKSSGYKKNRFRSEYDRAIEITNKILNNA